jgi:hypothetical protein
MNRLSERTQGFETEFKRNEEIRFAITARRNKLFGLWAAARLRLSAGKATEDYAKAVVAADFEGPGDGDVIAKVRADLAAKGVPASDAQLRLELAVAAAEARRQLLGS